MISVRRHKVEKIEENQRKSSVGHLGALPRCRSVSMKTQVTSIKSVRLRAVHPTNAERTTHGLEGPPVGPRRLQTCNRRQNRQEGAIRSIQTERRWIGRLCLAGQMPMGQPQVPLSSGGWLRRFYS